LIAGTATKDKTAAMKEYSQAIDLVRKCYNCSKKLLLLIVRCQFSRILKDDRSDSNTGRKLP
jgi:hypothetical protein